MVRPAMPSHFMQGVEGPFVREYRSIDSVKKWADANNYVVGVPRVNVPTFSIRHFDGSELSDNELTALDCGQEKHYERQQQIFGTDSICIHGLYAVMLKAVRSIKERNVVISIEKAKLDEFYRLYNSNRFSGQRLGQAFFNHFELHKCVQYKPQLDRLYNMDGDSAKHYISMLVEPC